DRVLAATGAARVELFGHSEGTVMPRWYLNKLGGDRKVAESVNLTPMWQGTSAIPAPVMTVLNPVAQNGSHFLPGSDYLNEGNSGDASPSAVHFTSIVTTRDEEVVPSPSGIAPAGPNISNIVLQDACPADLAEHNLAAMDPIAAQYVLNALD